jgi:flagellar motor switch protein FliN/FliY
MSDASKEQALPVNPGIPSARASEPDTGTAGSNGQASGTYARADFQSLAAEPPSKTANEPNLDLILDIPVTLSMEVGRKRISIRNLLQLNQGSVVELDRIAGAPMDVLVNGTLIAHGEVVVVNDKFGIRLTDVVSLSERVKGLR